jgi:hypothetical protein
LYTVVLRKNQKIVEKLLKNILMPWLLKAVKEFSSIPP